MSIVAPAPAHAEFYKDLNALLKKHCGKLSAIELLAISSQIVGKIMALQDQRTITSNIAIQVVMSNIEIGNHQIMDQLSGPAGRA